MQLFLRSSRFDWQNQFLFLENNFSEELPSYWFLALYATRFSDENKQPWLIWGCLNLSGEIMAESRQWVSNINFEVSLKREEYHVYMAPFTIPISCFAMVLIWVHKKIDICQTDYSTHPKLRIFFILKSSMEVRHSN